MTVSVRRSLWIVAPLLLSACTYLAGSQAQTTPPAPVPPTPAPSAATPPAAQATPPAGGNPFALTFKTPDAKKGEQLAASCAGCHGEAGHSTNEGTPVLAGQIPEYVRLQLAAFRAKLRPSPTMQAVAAKLSDQDIVDLAAYFEAQAPGSAWKADATARAKGEKLFNAGDAARNVIACAICHGMDGRGVAHNGVASITNQAPKYAVAILHEFRDAPSFGGVVHPEAMRIALKPLTDTDLTDVAAYISSMK